jgi:hypothetical protein
LAGTGNVRTYVLNSHPTNFHMAVFGEERLSAEIRD